MAAKGSKEKRAWQIPEGWEAVIGLEVHSQLRTEAKLFSRAPNRFGAQPNTQTSEVDLGLPGVLPVVNERAVELAVRLAVALGCTVHPISIFARKHYFYPDLPKGYQISQYEEPYSTGGEVPIRVADGGDAVGRAQGEVRCIPLTRIHMEEDTGKMIHDDAVTGAGASHVDLNRAGVPLIEIVSEPAMRTPAEAGAYLRSLHAIVRWLDVSDGDMEKGNFRCDGNVSVRPRGETALGTKVELKNLNSFRFLERALEFEIERQIEVLGDGGEIHQETRGWDERRACTVSQRSKEDADDYRYFPEPDLAPLCIAPELIERVRSELPELPLARARRYRDELGLPDYDAAVLTEDRAVADFFEATVALFPEPKTVSNWVMRSLLEALAARPGGLAELRITPAHLAELLEIVRAGRVTQASAREVFAQICESGEAPDRIVQTRGLEAVSDSGELEALARDAVSAHPEQAAAYRAGEHKLFNFFVGQLMKQTRGQADPGAVRDVLKRLLDGDGS